MGGPHIRVDSTIQILSKLCDLHIISLTGIDSIGGRTGLKYFKSISRSFVFTELVSPKLIHKFKGLVGRIFLLLGIRKYGRQKNEYWIENYLINNKINILWVSYANLEIDLIRKLKKAIPDLVLVGDTDSVWSKFLSRGIKYQQKNILSEVRNASYIETELVKICDIITTVSKIDSDYFKNLNGSASIELFPNFINTKPLIIKTNNTYQKYILLPGSFGPNSPMNDAAQWLCKNIMPLVWRKQSKIKVVLAGNNSNNACLDMLDHRIIRTGAVKNISILFKNAQLIVVPLRFESGTRYKILEAGVYKKAVVSTELGSEGLDLVTNKQILIANTSKDFAANILNILNSIKTKRKLSKNLYNAVCYKYSLKCGKSFAAEIIEKLKLK